MALEGLPGVEKVTTVLERNLFRILHDANRVSSSRLLEEIEGLGFSPRELTEEEATRPMEPVETAAESRLIARLKEQARRQNKPLVLEFSGKWCPSCAKLEKITLDDPSVRQALEKVIFHRILVEEERDAARQFGIRGIPQLRFLNPSGDVVAEASGFIGVATMLSHLRELDAR